MAPGVAALVKREFAVHEDVVQGALLRSTERASRNFDVHSLSMSGVRTELICAFSTKEITRGPGP